MIAQEEEYKATVVFTKGPSYSVNGIISTSKYIAGQIAIQQARREGFNCPVRDIHVKKTLKRWKG